MLVVDLLGHELVPEQARHRSEERAGIGAEGAGLDQRHARPAAEIDRPVDGVVRGQCAAIRVYEPGFAGSFGVGAPPFEKSRWKAEAVGSDWPWYFEPSSFEPYGRSTALDIRKNEIWPIFIPK